jgi:hypothetical protein
MQSALLHRFCISGKAEHSTIFESGTGMRLASHQRLLSVAAAAEANAWRADAHHATPPATRGGEKAPGSSDAAESESLRSTVLYSMNALMFRFRSPPVPVLGGTRSHAPGPTLRTGQDQRQGKDRNCLLDAVRSFLHPPVLAPRSLDIRWPTACSFDVALTSLTLLRWCATWRISGSTVRKALILASAPRFGKAHL